MFMKFYITVQYSTRVYLAWRIGSSETRISESRGSVIRRNWRKNRGHFINPSRADERKTISTVERVRRNTWSSINLKRAVSEGIILDKEAARNLRVWLPLITPGPGWKSWNLSVPSPSKRKGYEGGGGKRESKKSTEREEEGKEKGGWSKRETLSACQEFSIVNELLIWLSRKLFQEVRHSLRSPTAHPREKWNIKGIIFFINLTKLK